MENPTTDGNEHLRDPEEPIEFLVTILDQEKHGGVTGVRICTYGKKTFRLERKDPYGFWKIIPSEGSLPEKLKQHYTSHITAAKDLEIYCRSLSR
jgi:hypothetical protein